MTTKREAVAKRYTPSERAGAVGEAVEIGVAKAARRLGAALHSLYRWLRRTQRETGVLVERKWEPAELGSLGGSGVAPQSFGYLEDSEAAKLWALCAEAPSVPPVFVLIGGKRGVGKTSLCAKWLAPAGSHCVSAGRLVSEGAQSLSTDKAVSDVGANQVRLTRALEPLKGTHCRLALDGHFAVLSKHGEFEKTPFDVFRALGPTHIALLRHSPEVILRRLEARDGRAWDPARFRSRQEVDAQHAHAVAHPGNIVHKLAGSM